MVSSDPSRTPPPDLSYAVDPDKLRLNLARIKPASMGNQPGDDLAPISLFPPLTPNLLTPTSSSPLLTPTESLTPSPTSTNKLRLLTPLSISPLPTPADSAAASPTSADKPKSLTPPSISPLPTPADSPATSPTSADKPKRISSLRQFMTPSISTTELPTFRASRENSSKSKVNMLARLKSLGRSEELLSISQALKFYEGKDKFDRSLPYFSEEESQAKMRKVFRQQLQISLHVKRENREEQELKLDRYFDMMIKASSHICRYDLEKEALAKWVYNRMQCSGVLTGVLVSRIEYIQALVFACQNTLKFRTPWETALIHKLDDLAQLAKTDMHEPQIFGYINKLNLFLNAFSEKDNTISDTIRTCYAFIVSDLEKFLKAWDSPTESIPYDLKSMLEKKVESYHQARTAQTSLGEKQWQFKADELTQPHKRGFDKLSTENPLTRRNIVDHYYRQDSQTMGNIILINDQPLEVNFDKLSPNETHAQFFWRTFVNRLTLEEDFLKMRLVNDIMYAYNPTMHYHCHPHYHFKHFFEDVWRLLARGSMITTLMVDAHLRKFFPKLFALPYQTQAISPSYPAINFKPQTGKVIISRWYKTSDKSASPITLQSGQCIDPIIAYWRFDAEVETIGFGKMKVTLRVPYAQPVDPVHPKYSELVSILLNAPSTLPD